MKGEERLLELQGLDSTIDRLEHRRTQLEAGEELAVARKAAEEADSRLGEIRLALDALASEQARLEREIDSLTQKETAESKRMYDGSIVNAKELEALQHEIASLRERRSRSEDEVLERMERREELEARATVAEGEATEARTKLESVGGESVHELEQVEADLDARRTERAGVAPQIDPELLELYEDLRAQKRGIGAAALVDGVCQACHEKLSAMELDRLKRTDGVRRCEYCRRILVL